MSDNRGWGNRLPMCKIFSYKMRTLIGLCQWEDKPVRERNGHPQASYASQCHVFDTPLYNVVSNLNSCNCISYVGQNSAENDASLSVAC